MTTKPKLTPRQSEVLSCILNGKIDKEIADACNISEETVAYHVRKLFFVYRVHSRIQLMSAYYTKV